jgi:predicted nucleotide-binding protein
VKMELDYLKKLLEAGQASDKPTFDIEDLKTAGFDYGDAKFEFHMMILTDRGFIEQDDGSPGFGLAKSLDGSFCQWSVLPLRLTSSGHQFSEALSTEEVWTTIKHGYPNASIATLEVVALKLLEDYAQKKIAKEPKVNSKTGTTVFIGHGQSPLWRELKDFLGDRLHLAVNEFNSMPTAGVPTAERLTEMLDAAAFAFLIMTAEDEQPDGKLRAHDNVVHEAGLFQGRLGFKKAIILLERGCEEFSNIHGLGQIRFPKGNISAQFEEIRRVLERERIIT